MRRPPAMPGGRSHSPPGRAASSSLPSCSRRSDCRIASVRPAPRDARPARNRLPEAGAIADHHHRRASRSRGKTMNDRYLRSGIFLAPFHNHDENPTLSIERDIELLEHLDRLNYHEAWIGEHHSGGFELIASPEMFIAAAAQRTRHIRLGTGVVSLPYHNPFMLADRMVQLDHMTRGRAMFGVGPGALVHDALKIGIDPSEQRRMMEESFDVVVRLMRGELVNRKTDWFNLTDAQ